MNIDIVDRLRINWTSMTDMGNAERLQAADEIERLRNALRAIADNKNDEPYAADFARDELVRNADEFRETITELRQRVETLTAERDEARREICEKVAAYSASVTAKQWARERGWDCFKGEE
jgi:predicted  nucleic acid-binding Zn-ribbon protein